METHKFVDVVEVEELDYTEDVYDITVEDNHNFFANGVVVHNCLGGIYSGAILRGEAYGKTSDQIIAELQNLTDQFTSAVDPDSFFLELQFNKLLKQHTVNKYLIQLARQSGVKLIATCDSHYPDPSKWQARELYKKLGWMGQKLDEQALPKFEDLKCELYPKNATQMWAEYAASYDQYEFYRGTEEEVRDAIERTHDIAWQMCDDTWVDVKAKLPRFSTPEKSAMKQLVEILKEKMIEQGLADRPEYVARLKEELEVVKAKQFEDYFLTLYKIFQRASKRVMIGPGRGSGSGSLINYLLEITHVDPIKYGLLFSRFINMGRKGFPDVDCVHNDHLVIMHDMSMKRIRDVSVGDLVLGSDMRSHAVTFVSQRPLREDEDEMSVIVESRNVRGDITCTPSHKFVLSSKEVVTCTELQVGDTLLSTSGVATVTDIIVCGKTSSKFIDITVEDNHCFHVVPFDVDVTDCTVSRLMTYREFPHP